MTDDGQKTIKRRAVFFIGGFDPKSAEQFFARLERENRRFDVVWNTRSTKTDTTSLAKDITRTHFTTRGTSTAGDWVVDTDFHFLTLDDVVLAEFRKPLPLRFWRYLVTFLDYFLSGTAFSFIRHAWRFFLYFAYPALMILLAIGLSLGLSAIVANSGVAMAPVAAVIVFCITLAGLVRFGGGRYHVLHLMDLWSFSRDFVHQINPLIRAKLDQFADHILAADQSGNYNEILMIGHSTGGALILDAAGRAAEKDGAFGSRNSDVVVLTVGSTALKVGLHPAANWFRERVGNLFGNHPLGWAEYQCMSDVINFYQTNPPKLMGIESAMQRPFLKRRIKVKDMIEPVTYKRLRKNFFRIHYQFVFGNNFKYHYDFPAICFAPAPVMRRISEPNPFMSHVDGISSQPSEVP